MRQSRRMHGEQYTHTSKIDSWNGGPQHRMSSMQVRSKYRTKKCWCSVQIMLTTLYTRADMDLMDITTWSKGNHCRQCRSQYPVRKSPVQTFENSMIIASIEGATCKDKHILPHHAPPHTAPCIIQLIIISTPRLIGSNLGMQHNEITFGALILSSLYAGGCCVWNAKQCSPSSSRVGDQSQMQNRNSAQLDRTQLQHNAH